MHNLKPDQSKNSKTKAVLIIAGEGGHIEQARRLSSHLNSEIKSSVDVVLLTDHERDLEAAFDQVLSVPTCAPKHRDVKIRDVLSYSLGTARVVFKIFRTYKVETVIVTGPGFALFPALTFRLLGATLIVFESWSRFEDKSKCSKSLYPFAHHFLVQHKELLKLYPKATWVGLL